MRFLLLALCLLVACHRTPPPAPETRIVAIGSAITEAVYALGAGDRVVGVDTSSLFPPEATKLPQVGYQRTLSAEGILGLRPTIVLAGSDAGPPAVLEQLRAAGVRLERLDGGPSVAAARARIAKVGELVGKDPAPVLATLDADLAHVPPADAHPKVLAIYARGGGTLNVFGTGCVADTMITLAGGQNAIVDFVGPKPLTAEALVKAAPDVIVIPARGLESIGGAAGLAAVPGVSETPAGKAKRFVAIDDLLLLGAGPRMGQGVVALARGLAPPAP